MTKRHDPEGSRLPIKLDSTSNGEVQPVALDKPAEHANQSASELVSVVAKRLGRSRREFLVSLSGAAATLVGMNQGFADTGKRGGYYAVNEEAVYEHELAAASLQGDEFIFDVQLHHVNPEGPWRGHFDMFESLLKDWPQNNCGLEDKVACYSGEHLVKEVFFDSDTDLAVLSMGPAMPDQVTLTIDDAAQTRALVKERTGEHRLLLHSQVNPNIPGHIEAMDRAAEEFPICAWKTYTQFGPGGGYWLDDPAGIAMIEKARSLGIKTICVHKGLPLGIMGHEYSTCADVGRVAKMFPDVTFIVYHSGHEPEGIEGPYDPSVNYSINTLINSLRDNNIGPNGNVYAELGSTWRFVMRDPDQSAHTIGKLLKYVGEDRLLWGTDCIWYGSPQDQIQAFRTFQISEEFQEKYGYSTITPEVRAKVFGLSAAKAYAINPDEIRKKSAMDALARERRLYREDPNPSFLTYGPKTRREFLAFKRLEKAGLV
ncbi:MAG: putative TIM-barrel fold metal-dependent hydrolase [Gammaproteobacteria bacterium]|jgi:predicted TIM-barrel fold metal-dependent hydrolase